MLTLKPLNPLTLYIGEYVQIAEKIAEGFVPVGGSLTPTELLDYFLAKNLAWQVKKDDALVGLFGLTIEDGVEKIGVEQGDEVWASTIYVFEGYRGQGIGTSLKRGSVEAYRGVSDKHLVSIVRDWNEASLGLNITLFPEVDPLTFSRPEKERVFSNERIAYVFHFEDALPQSLTLEEEGLKVAIYSALKAL